jgi:MFS family permease
METTRRWDDDDDARVVVVVVRGCRQSLWRATLTYAMVTMSVASGTTATMSVLTRELKFSERPEALNGYYASAFAVSALKPAWAWASDNNNNNDAGGRRRGRRRRRRAMHAAIGCVMASVASVGTATCRSEGMAYVWGMLASAGTSYAYAATDGYVVERAGRERKDAVATQSLAMGSRTFGSLCGEFLSAVTLAMASARVGMLACAGVVCVFGGVRVVCPAS